MISKYIIGLIRKDYQRRLSEALERSYEQELFFPSGKARELMRYLSKGRSMLVLMAPEGKGNCIVSAKSINCWETHGEVIHATDEEKREVLKASIAYLEKRGRKVVVIDPQPWQ